MVLVGSLLLPKLKDRIQEFLKENSDLFMVCQRTCMVGNTEIWPVHPVQAEIFDGRFKWCSCIDRSFDMKNTGHLDWYGTKLTTLILPLKKKQKK